MADFRSQWTRPLGEIESHFLQVLVSSFELHRTLRGSELHLRIDGDDLALCTGSGKTAVRETIPAFADSAREYQAELDSFLLRQEGARLSYHRPDFPMRYASGGALPVVRMGDADYFCLFYRDIFPCGWNIANGSCDTLGELLNPFDAVDRELREELLVAHPSKHYRYVFEDDSGRPFEIPEFAAARNVWRRRYPDLDLGSFAEIGVPLAWLDGPDSLLVEYEGLPSRRLHGCLLNINALDFGIEVDRIAQMTLAPDVVMIDGELKRGRVVNRPVGLFKVSLLLDALESAEHDFAPDVCFFDASRYEGREEFEGMVLPRFRRHLEDSGLRSKEELEALQAEPRPRDLCPVTRSILSRYVSMLPEAPAESPGELDAFISFGGEEDREAAERVHAYLTQRGVRSFYCWEEKDLDIIRVVREALESARVLLGVASAPANLRRRFPMYELDSFVSRKVFGPGQDVSFLSFVTGFHSSELPQPYPRYVSIEFTPERMEVDLGRLYEALTSYL